MGADMQQRARSEADKLEKKQKIHQAARQLFFEKGYRGTRIQAIAREAGISTGTFYLYYKNKIEIYKALQAEGIEILTEMIHLSVSRPGMVHRFFPSRFISRFKAFQQTFHDDQASFCQEGYCLTDSP